MDRFAGILLQMDALDANGNGLAIIAIDVQRPLPDNRMGKLADLIALWQIRIKIILPIKPAPQMDFSTKPKTCAHGLFDTKTVQNRQHAGHPRIHKADMGVGCPAISSTGP